MGHKIRLDNLLVERGLAESRAKAQALIMAGDVSVGGNTATKAGLLLDESVEVAIVETPPFVGRGGIKLDYALNEFGLDILGRVVVDIGASSGGFTDCLLKRGASRVYAVDVGYGQLNHRLQRDERVVVMDRVNARFPFSLPEKVDLATIDVSFISVAKVIPAVAKQLKDRGYLLVLLKPQFEAKKCEVGKGGVVRELQVQARVLGRFITWFTGRGFRLGGLVASPILGASGNKEFFILLLH